MANAVAPLPGPVADPSLASAAMRMGLALLLILAIILLGFWMLRRFGPKIGLGPAGRGGLLRLMGQLALGPRKSVVVVRFLNKDLVLGVTDQTITLLTEVPSDHDSSKAFADTLAQAAAAPHDGGPSS